LDNLAQKPFLTFLGVPRDIKTAFFPFRLFGARNSCRERQKSRKKERKEDQKHIFENCKNAS
jgi:hypothetical protein